jgi:hypothetical protein
MSSEIEAARAHRKEYADRVYWTGYVTRRVAPDRH